MWMAAGGSQVTAALERAVLANHLKSLLGQYGIEVVIDVGANVGQYGTLLREIGYAGAIDSYEPVDEAFRQLREAASDDEHWTVRQLALGARDEAGAINVASSSDFSSLRAANEYGSRLFGERSTVTSEQPVELRRLDSLLEAGELMAAGALLKTDTQGWDLDVLAGAQSALGKVRAVQVELAFRPIYRGMPEAAETIAYLGERGFEPTGLFPVTRDSELRLIEADLVAVKP
jgi:FkbM family methyltransferase